LNSVLTCCSFCTKFYDDDITLCYRFETVVQDVWNHLTVVILCLPVVLLRNLDNRHVTDKSAGWSIVVVWCCTNQTFLLLQVLIFFDSNV
jgi:hypothetical protein